MNLYSCHHKGCTFVPTICKACFIVHMQTTQFYKNEKNQLKMHRQDAFHQNFFDYEHHNDCNKKDSVHPLALIIEKIDK